MCDDYLELADEETLDYRIRRWLRRVGRAIAGRPCPGCESLELRLQRARAEAQEAREKYERLRDHLDAEPVRLTPVVGGPEEGGVSFVELPRFGARASEPTREEALKAATRVSTALGRAQQRSITRTALERRAPTNAEIAAMAAEKRGDECTG